MAGKRGAGQLDPVGSKGQTPPPWVKMHRIFLYRSNTPDNSKSPMVRAELSRNSIIRRGRPNATIPEPRGKVE